MGQCFEFICSECGHTTEVSGEPDSGMFSQTETMLCGTCKDLVDVVVEVGPPGKSTTKKERLTCPNCHGTALNEWDQRKKPCPKCGAAMEKGCCTIPWD